MSSFLFRLGAAVEGALGAARARVAREEGQALVEYALILFMIAIVCVGVLSLLGGRVSDVLNTVVNAF